VRELPHVLPCTATGDVGPNVRDANVTFERAVEHVTNGGGGCPHTATHRTVNMLAF